MIEFTLIEALLTMAVMVPIGVLTSVATWKWIERRNGRIRLLESELVEKSRGLNVDPEEVVRTGLMLSAMGATERQINIYAKMTATGTLTNEMITQLKHEGMRIYDRR